MLTNPNGGGWSEIDEALTQLMAHLSNVRHSTSGHEPSIGKPLAKIARDYLQLRRDREQLVPGLFADPAWDILLDLFVAEAHGKRTSVSNACIASGAPPSTALRYVNKLTDVGLIVRSDDGEDGRRVNLKLTNSGTRLVQEFLLGLGKS